MSFAGFGKKGFPSTNITLTVQPDGSLIWETMQTSEKSGICFWRGEMDKALERLQQLVRDHPRRPFFWTRLGTHLRRMGRDTEAEDAFRRALTLDGADTTARLNLMAIEQKRKASARPPAR